MWREEIYERAPDFKVRVASARFRSAEWRFLAALDGKRSAGEIALALQLDPVAIGRFVEAQEAAGAIVPRLLSFEEFERTIGPVADDSIARDFPQAGLTALREEPSRSAAAVDTSLGAAFEGLRKLRARPAPAAHEPTDGTPTDAAPTDGAPSEPADLEAPEITPAQASIVEAITQPDPAAPGDRAIVHQSATVIPLASMLERVQKPRDAQPPDSANDDVTSDAAAWQAALERTRNGVRPKPQDP